MQTILHQTPSRRRVTHAPSALAARLPLRRLAAFAGAAAFVLLWQIVASLEVYPRFIIPLPIDVLHTFIEVVQDGRLFHHAGVTIGQMMAGLVVGGAAGVVLGYGLAKSRALEDALAPLILAFQSTPVVAYAPLLVIWFGSGATSKIIICALIASFPLLMNTLIGVRSVPTEQRELMTLYAASRWQTFIKLEVPAALPVLLGGLKVSATLAVIGAVVGEFVGANAGLGFLINLARSQYDTPLVFVGVIALAMIARVLYGLIGALEAHLLRGQRAQNTENGMNRNGA